MKQSRLFNFPFYILLISLLMPMFAAYFWIEMHRILLLFCIYIFAILNIVEKNIFIIKRSHFWFLFFLFFLFLLDLLSGRKLYYFSYSHVVFYTLIFYYSFKIGNKPNTDKVIIKQISFIYCLLLSSMILEMAIQLSGNTNILLSAFTSKSGELSMQQYVIYHNRFTSKINIDLTALNSILLGNQIGSQLSLSAMIWFLPLYYGNKSNSIFKYQIIWSIVALFIFIINPTMMTYLIFMICLFLFIFILPISRIKSFKIGIVFIFILFLFSTIIQKFMFPIFFQDRSIVFQGFNYSMFQYYIYGFLHPFINFLELPLFEKLFGNMNPGWSEFGYIKLLIANGILWTLFMTFGIFTVIYSALKLSKIFDKKLKSHLQDNKMIKIWIWVAQANAMILIIYLLSTFHYLVIFRLGVLQLFSFHIAVTMFAISKTKKLINNKIKNIPQLNLDY